MPQWDRAQLGNAYPDERWQATCPPDVVPLLLRYDHHTVWIGGRPALILTYEWALDAPPATDASRTLTVSFTYPKGHPRAPAEVQAIIDRLTFAPIGDRDPAS